MIFGFGNSDEPESKVSVRTAPHLALFLAGPRAFVRKHRLAFVGNKSMRAQKRSGAELIWLSPAQSAESVTLRRNSPRTDRRSIANDDGAFSLTCG